MFAEGKQQTNRRVAQRTPLSPKNHQPQQKLPKEANLARRNPIIHHAPARLRLDKPATAASRGAKQQHLVHGDSYGFLHDPRWREKRELGFKVWINHHLSGGKCDKLEPCSLGASQRHALSVQDVESKNKESALRRRAMTFLRRDLRQVIIAIERQVESGIISVRDPLNLLADVGQRDNLLNLLGCYNPLWLGLALEVVSGEALPSGVARDDAGAIRRFADRHVYAPPQIAIPSADAGTHPERAFRQAKKMALENAHKLIVRRSLCAFLLLDFAKGARIYATDPCLFRPNAKLKSTRTIIVEFARSFLSGRVGDLFKHLQSLGAQMSHVQTALNEYDFNVTCLASDLRDGARLCRLIEVLAENGKRELTSQLRIPAVNRTSRLKNVEIALRRMSANNTPLIDAYERGSIDLGTCARLVVDGHREGSLELIWSLALNCSIPLVAPDNLLCRETSRVIRSSRANNISLDLPTEDESNSCCAPCILKWTSAICATYGLKVYDISSSLKDGRVLCALLHYYVPESLGALHPDKFAARDADNTYTTNKHVSRRLLNAAVSAMTLIGQIPIMFSVEEAIDIGLDEQVAAIMLAHLFPRLLEHSQMQRAITVIQNKWRSHSDFHLNGRVPKSDLKRSVSAIRIQRCWRALPGARMLMAEALVLAHRLKLQRSAALKIVAAVRATHPRRVERNRARASARIQASVRMSKVRGHYQRLRHSAQIIGLAWGIRHRRLEQNVSAALIQSSFRVSQCMRKLKSARIACIVLQANARKRAAARTLRRVQASVRLQAFMRGVLLRHRLSRSIAAVTLVQASYRMHLVRKRMLIMVEAVTCISSTFRSIREMRNKFNRVRACSCIQMFARMYLINYHEHYHRSAQVAQAAWRGFVARRHIADTRRAAVSLQAACRSQVCRRAFVAAKGAATTLCAVSRGLSARRQIANMWVAALLIQTAWRGAMSRSWLDVQHAAAAYIQTKFRAQRFQREVVRNDAASIVIQAAARRRIAVHAYHLMRQSCILLQSHGRRAAASRKFQHHCSTRTIQAAWRGFVARRHIADTRRAAVSLQAACRSQVCRRAFVAAKGAATTLCAVSRGFFARRQKSILLCLCKQIQSVWRGMKARKNINLERAASILMQTAWRRHACKLAFFQQRMAAIIVQKWVRRYIVMLQLDFHSYAAAIIQRHGRGLLARRIVGEIRREISCVITIQTFARVHMARNCARTLVRLRDLAKLAELERSAIFLQDYVRMRISCHRRRSAAHSISDRALTYIWQARRRRFTNGMSMLRATFRANKVRRIIYRRMPELRCISERLSIAHRRMLADPSLQLGPRTNAALKTLLASRNLGAVLKSIATLELFTMVSKQVCERMIVEGSVPVIVKLLRTCNRSVPHQKAVGHALRVLCNVGKYKHLMESLWKMPDVVTTVLELAMSFREHELLLFDSLSVLNILIVKAPKSRRVEISNNMPESLKRLQSLYHLLGRKNTQKRKANMAGAERRPTLMKAKDEQRAIHCLTTLSDLVSAIQG